MSAKKKCGQPEGQHLETKNASTRIHEREKEQQMTGKIKGKFTAMVEKKRERDHRTQKHVEKRK